MVLLDTLTSLEEKKAYSLKLLKKYPNRIPVIIEKSETVELDNYKYILPKESTISTFLNIIRTKMKITNKQAIFTFVKSINQDYVMVPMSETVETIYNTHRAEDGFLYFKFGIENTFG